jgi:hypothetical protein
MCVVVAMSAAQPPRPPRISDVNLGRPRALARAAPSRTTVTSRCHRLRRWNTAASYQAHTAEASVFLLGNRMGELAFRYGVNVPCEGRCLEHCAECVLLKIFKKILGSLSRAPYSVLNSDRPSSA